MAYSIGDAIGSHKRHFSTLGHCKPHNPAVTLLLQSLSGVGQLWAALLRALGRPSEFERARAAAAAAKADPAPLHMPLRDPDGRLDDAALGPQRLLRRFSSSYGSTAGASYPQGVSVTSDRPLVVRQGSPGRDPPPQSRKYSTAGDSDPLVAGIAFDRPLVVGRGRQGRELRAEGLQGGAGDVDAEYSETESHSASTFPRRANSGHQGSEQRDDRHVRRHSVRKRSGGGGGSSRGGHDAAAAEERAMGHKGWLPLSWEAEDGAALLLPDSADAETEGPPTPSARPLPLGVSLTAASCRRCNPWRWLAMQSGGAHSSLVELMHAGI